MPVLVTLGVLVALGLVVWLRYIAPTRRLVRHLRVLLEVQQLSDFDNEAFIRAAGCADKETFLC